MIFGQLFPPSPEHCNSTCSRIIIIINNNTIIIIVIIINNTIIIIVIIIIINTNIIIIIIIYFNCKWVLPGESATTVRNNTQITRHTK
jgi:hypothetical protein